MQDGLIRECPELISPPLETSYNRTHRVLKVVATLVAQNFSSVDVGESHTNRATIDMQECRCDEIDFERGILMDVARFVQRFRELAVMDYLRKATGATPPCCCASVRKAGMGRSKCA